MAKKKNVASCCTPESMCCRVDAILTVDKRGQMVLPKEVRKKAGIMPGDKLALLCVEKDGKICCMTLVKTNDLGKSVKTMLRPMMDEVSKS